MKRTDGDRIDRMAWRIARWSYRIEDRAEVLWAGAEVLYWPPSKRSAWDRRWAWVLTRCGNLLYRTYRAMIRAALSLSWCEWADKRGLLN